MRLGTTQDRGSSPRSLRLDASTVQTYTDALEDHILPALGIYYYDQLMSTDVQKWIDGEMLLGWTTDVKRRQGRKKKERRFYRIRPGRVIRAEREAADRSHVARAKSITSALVRRIRPHGLSSPMNRIGQVSLGLSSTAAAMNTGCPTCTLSAA